ncbi:MAG: hypothetical protein WCI22_02310 [Actinomycetota bacterium]
MFTSLAGRGSARLEFAVLITCPPEPEFADFARALSGRVSIDERLAAALTVHEKQEPGYVSKLLLDAESAAARASGELNAGPPDERPLGARVCEALDHAVRNANPMAALDRMEGDPDPAAVAALLDLARLYAVFQDMAARLELRGRRRFEPAH